MKDSIKEIRRQTTDLEKIFARDTSDEELSSQIYKDSKTQQ